VFSGEFAPVTPYHGAGLFRLEPKVGSNLQADLKSPLESATGCRFDLLLM